MCIRAVDTRDIILQMRGLTPVAMGGRPVCPQDRSATVFASASDFKAYVLRTVITHRTLEVAHLQRSVSVTVVAVRRISG